MQGADGSVLIPGGVRVGWRGSGGGFRDRARMTEWYQRRGPSPSLPFPPPPVKHAVPSSLMEVVVVLFSVQAFDLWFKLRETALRNIVLVF